MKLDVLICTYNDGIARIPAILLPPRSDVSYVVSMQYTDESYLQHIPAELSERSDVRIVPIEGLGLCRNRNNALRAATGDIALIADDDVRYRNEYFDRVIEVFTRDSEVDVAQFMIKSRDGGFIKEYPTHSYTHPRVPRGMYVTSPEIAIRLSTTRGRIYFDERFGLGSPHFICGEEEVFFTDAVRQGLTVRYFPQYVVEAPSDSTGVRTYSDERVMMAKGAINYYIHGASAWLRMFKFALVGAVTRRGSFATLLRGTFKGINHYRKVVRYENPIGR